MDDGRRFEKLATSVDAALGRLALVPPPLRAARELFIDEVFRSTTLAGASLTRPEVEALLERDTVAPGRTLAENVLVADYGDAARLVRSAPLPRRRSVLAVDEIAALHALAVRRTLGSRPGRWRETTAAPFPSGMVPPPAWSVPREIAAFVDRFASGPPTGMHRIAWAADAHARFTRIHPFETANGRAARLVTNLLLRRAGIPPLVVRRADALRYERALRAADSRNIWPLALLIARSTLDGAAKLLAESERDDGLRPVATFADGARKAALYKAAQRGRLPTVRRDGQLLTRAEWIAQYEARRPRIAREQHGDGDDPRDARPL
jgi:Fic family protein